MEGLISIKFKISYLVIFLVILLIGCSSTESNVEKEEIISSMLADENGEYYITILGASQDTEQEFDAGIYQDHMRIISGYYSNANPTEREIRALEIKEKPVFIVFDTESEVFRTNDINDLNVFLSENK